jgi:hypothetical protein
VEAQLGPGRRCPMLQQPSVAHPRNRLCVDTDVNI